MPVHFDTEEEALAWANRNQAKKPQIKSKKRKKPALPVPSEDQECKDFIYWTEIMKTRYQDLDMIYHVANGGRRDDPEAAKFQAMGVKAGVLDYCLPVARGAYHGLYIEMKRIDGGEGASDKQIAYIKRLIRQGYWVKVARGFAAARKIVEKYYKMERYEIKRKATKIQKT